MGWGGSLLLLSAKPISIANLPLFVRSRFSWVCCFAGQVSNSRVIGGGLKNGPPLLS